LLQLNFATLTIRAYLIPFFSFEAPKLALNIATKCEKCEYFIVIQYIMIGTSSLIHFAKYFNLSLLNIKFENILV
jgi:hypothetical protein